MLLSIQDRIFVRNGNAVQCPMETKSGFIVWMKLLRTGLIHPFNQWFFLRRILLTTGLVSHQNICFWLVAGENTLLSLKLYDLKVVILKKRSLIYKVDILQNTVWKHSNIVYSKKWNILKFSIIYYQNCILIQ